MAGPQSGSVWELRRRVPAPNSAPAEPDSLDHSPVGPAADWAIRLFGSETLRAKQVVSGPGDPAEREADAVANAATGSCCDSCASGGPCEPGGVIQRKQEATGTGEGNLIGVQAAEAAQGLAAVLGSGRPLEAASQHRFEGQLGTKFDDVRLHTDEHAAMTAQAMGALAYTLGTNIVFAKGRHAPGTGPGDRLLAHELTHVVQGRRGRKAGIRRQADPGASTVTESEQGPPGPAPEWFTFRSVQMSTDPAFMRWELKLLIRRFGIKGGDQWFDSLRGQGRDIHLPFSAHARAYGGLRVRSPIDEQREMQNDAVRRKIGPIALRLAMTLYPEVRREAVELLQTFAKGLRTTLETILRESEVRLEMERARYGVQRESRGPGGAFSAKRTVAFEALVGAAKDLLAIRERISALQRQQHALKVSRGKAGYVLPESNRAKHDALGAQVVEIEKEYDQARAAASLRQPVLGAILDDAGTAYGPMRLASLARGETDSPARGHFSGPPGTAGQIGLILEHRQASIDEVREKVDDDPDRLWDLHEIVALTRFVLGTRNKIMADKVVDEKLAQRAFDATFTKLFLGAVALALAIPSGGTSVLAVGAALSGAVLSGYMMLQSISKYQFEMALTTTDLDKRAYAISTEEPSSFWLAMDVVFFVADGAMALKAVRGLRSMAREALLAGEGAEALEAASKLERAAESVPGLTRPGLGKRLVESLARMRKIPRSARRLGVAGAAEAKAVAEAGQLIAKEARGAETIVSVAGHDVKATRSGHLVICTECTWLRERFARELAGDTDLARRMAEAEGRAAAGAVGAAGKADVAALVKDLRAARRARAVAELGPQGVKAAEMAEGLLRRVEAQGMPREDALRMLGLRDEDELIALAAGVKTHQELRTALLQRAEVLGVTARAEAAAVGRGKGAFSDEALEDLRVMNADDLRTLARSAKPLPTGVEKRLLQDAVDDVSTRLLLDPDEAAKMLSQAELRAVAENPGLTGAYFGNAVERRLALELADAPSLQRFLHTPQRPGVSTPDIGGPIRPSGPRAYDVTTSNPRAIAAHEQRSYAPFTEWVTYPSLPWGWRFPPH